VTSLHDASHARVLVEAAEDAGTRPGAALPPHRRRSAAAARPTGGPGRAAHTDPARPPSRAARRRRSAASAVSSPSQSRYDRGGARFVPHFGYPVLVSV